MNRGAQPNVTGRRMTGPQVRAHFGGISDMTLWRWLHDPCLAFPQPIYINARRYWREDEILAYVPPQMPKRAA